MKSSLIMVRLKRPLRFLPPAWIEALSRICFDWIQGIDQKHDRRWRRMLRGAFHSRDQHPVFQFYLVRERSGRFHRRHMAIEGQIFANQEAFPPTRAGREGFRDWLKVGAHHGHWEAWQGQLLFVPDSVDYDECSDDEMREFHEAAMEFLRTPYALEHLWPMVKPQDRTQMLEAALRDPDEPEGES